LCNKKNRKTQEKQEEKQVKNKTAEGIERSAGSLP
jgi:hypothetical protein